MAEALLREADPVALLREGLSALPFTVRTKTLNRLTVYLRLLGKWNRVHNLTAVRSAREQVRVHVLDCLAVHPHLDARANYIADIGSGAGLPGIMLALCRPETTVFLVEAKGKKCAFLREVRRRLALANVQLVVARSEKWQPPVKMDIIIARAISAIDPFLSSTAHLGGAHTLWALMKAHDQEPCTTPGFAISAAEKVNVPLLEAPRLLIKIKRSNSGS